MGHARVVAGGFQRKLVGVGARDFVDKLRGVVAMAGDGALPELQKRVAEAGLEAESFEKPKRRFFVAVGKALVQWGLAFVVGQVRLKAFGAQGMSKGLEIAVPCAVGKIVEKGIALLVGGSDVGSGLDEKRGDFARAQSRLVQGSQALAVGQFKILVRMVAKYPLGSGDVVVLDGAGQAAVVFPKAPDDLVQVGGASGLRANGVADVVKNLKGLLRGKVGVANEMAKGAGGPGGDPVVGVFGQIAQYAESCARLGKMSKKVVLGKRGLVHGRVWVVRSNDDFIA